VLTELTRMDFISVGWLVKDGSQRKILNNSTRTTRPGESSRSARRSGLEEW